MTAQEKGPALQPQDEARDHEQLPLTSVPPPPFQVMPDLAPDEYEALKVDIAERGIHVPVLIDENGEILDGHHRERIGKELGIDVPHELKSGLTRAQKIDLALSLNIHRRHLTREQKRDLVERYIKAAPAKSDLQIAKATGVSDKTVTARRRELEARSEIPNAAVKVDTKGRQQPARALKSPRRIPNVLLRFEDAVIRIRSGLKDLSGAEDSVRTRFAQTIAPLAVSLLRACFPALSADERQSMLRDSGLSDDVRAAVAEYEERAAQSFAEEKRWRDLAASKGVISKEELGILRSALHPDRTPSEKTRSDAMAIINRIDTLIAPAAVPARRKPRSKKLPTFRDLIEAKEEKDLQKRDERNMRAAQRRASARNGSAP